MIVDQNDFRIQRRKPFHEPTQTPNQRRKDSLFIVDGNDNRQARLWRSSHYNSRPRIPFRFPPSTLAHFSGEMPSAISRNMSTEPPMLASGKSEPKIIRRSKWLTRYRKSAAMELNRYFCIVSEMSRKAFGQSRTASATCMIQVPPPCTRTKVREGNRPTSSWIVSTGAF